MIAENLDYNKPIFAHSLKHNATHMLLPHLERTSGYTAKGYDWFNIVDFEWNSCRFYDTKKIAVDEYGGLGSNFNICNGVLLFGDNNYDVQQFIINKGEELYVVYSDRRRKGEGFNGKVLKVGRKYFKMIPVGYPEDTNFNMSFEIENWRQKTNYSPDYCLYESEQAYKDHVRRQEWIQEFYKVFSQGNYAQDHMTLEDLEKAGKILGISIDDKNHAESF